MPPRSPTSWRSAVTGRGRDDGRLGAGSPRVSRAVDVTSLVAPARARGAARTRGGSPRRRRLRDEHDPACRDRLAPCSAAARREARVRRGVRAGDEERALRGDARRVPGTGAMCERGSFARRATPRFVGRATSSARARTCATSRFAGDSIRNGCRCSPNPAPEVPPMPSRDELRAELGLDWAGARLRRPPRSAEGARCRARGSRHRSRRDTRDCRRRA